AYLTPFVKPTMGIDGTWISIVYLIFGIAAVSGGGIGGAISDRFGATPTIFICTILFTFVLFAIPYTTFSIPVFISFLIMWGILSWAITPAIQSYLIGTSPETSDIQQSLNNSALHFGIAFGSFIGGMVIEQVSVVHNAAVGGMIVILSFGAALISMFGISSWKKSKTIHRSQK